MWRGKLRQQCASASERDEEDDGADQHKEEDEAGGHAVGGRVLARHLPGVSSPSAGADPLMYRSESINKCAPAAQVSLALPHMRIRLSRLRKKNSGDLILRLDICQLRILQGFSQLLHEKENTRILHLEEIKFDSARLWSCPRSSPRQCVLMSTRGLAQVPDGEGGFVLLWEGRNLLLPLQFCGRFQMLMK